MGTIKDFNNRYKFKIFVKSGIDVPQPFRDEINEVKTNHNQLNQHMNDIDIQLAEAKQNNNSISTNIVNVNNEISKIKKVQENQNSINEQKVDKVEGKHLSSEDYTTLEKTKLLNIEENANVNILETLTLSGKKLNNENKNIEIKDKEIEDSRNSIIKGKTFNSLGSRIEEVENDYNSLNSSKVAKEEGKVLSSNDFTNQYKEKLENLQNYDDEELRKKYAKLQKENEYLNNVINQSFSEVTESGTDIIISDTIESKMNLKLFGNSFQKDLKGLQLLDFKNVINLLNLKYSFENDTISLNSDNIIYANVKINILNIVNENIGKTLYFNYEKYEAINCKGYFCQLNIQKADNSWVYVNMLSNDNIKKSYHLNEDLLNCKVATFSIYTNNSRDSLNGESKLTIVKPILSFQQNAEYEIYNNQLELPNINQPQNFENVTGMNYIEIKTPNIFNEEMIQPFNDKTTVIKNNNIIIYSNSNNYDITITIYEGKLKKGKLFINVASPLLNEINIYKNGKFYLELLRSNSLSNSVIIDDDNLYKIVIACKQNQEISLNQLCISNVDFNNKYTKYNINRYAINLKELKLNGIDHNKDYLKIENNKWYLIKNIKEEIFNGSETWDKASNQVSSFSYAKLYDKIQGLGNIYCNKLKFKGNAQSIKLGYAISANPLIIYKQYIYVQVPENIVEVGDVVTFKSWLSRNPITILYPTTESQKIEITDNELIEQLNNLKNALSKKGTTIITQENQKMPFFIEATALQSNNTKIKNLEKAIIALGGNI